MGVPYMGVGWLATIHPLHIGKKQPREGLDMICKVFINTPPV